MFTFRTARYAAAVAVAALLAACAGQGSTPPVSSPFAGAGTGAALKDNAKISAKPAKLNFTTSPTMKLTFEEAKYKGQFTLTTSPGGVVKLSKTKVKGPKATVTVTALAAGKTTITATDSSKNKTSVPVTVTQGVIIIQ